MTANAQLARLLTNRELDQFARLRLNVPRRYTNRARGEHLAAKGGTSTEFCDYRDYAPGDDVRYVDWNIFARIQRPYLKQFHQEEELHVAIVVDASTSMAFEDKAGLARRLAAAFSIISLRASEKVSVSFVGGEAVQRLHPITGRASQRKILEFIESARAGGTIPFDKGIEAFLRHHRGRGVAILLSDFMSADDFARPFNLLSSAGLEVFALQILGTSEMDPGITGDLRLVDSESHAPLDITSAADLFALYHEYRERHASRLAELCRQREGRFHTVISTQPLASIILDTLRRRGWVI